MANPIPIYVVNLARATQRRAVLSAQLTEMGLTAEFPPAFDAQTEPDDALYKGFRQWGPWGALRRGDIACSQSHRLLWQKFLGTSHSHVLILEDDVILSDRLPALLRSTDWWPEDADIVKIERWKSDRMKIVLGRVHTSHEGIDLRPLISRHPGSAAYLLNRRAAERLLAVNPQTVSVDHLLFNALTDMLPSGLRVLQAVPALVCQRDDGVEQMVPGTRPQLPRIAWLRQELARGLAELNFALRTMPKLVLKQAELIRLPLARDMEPRQ